MATVSERETDGGKERLAPAQKELPITERVSGSFGFEYRGKTYGTSFASAEDVIEILAGIRSGVEAGEEKTVDALIDTVSEDPAKAQEVRMEAAKEVENSQRVMQTDYQKVKAFFDTIMNETSVLPGAHTKGLFKLNEGASELLFSRYKQSFAGSELHPVMTSKHYEMSKDCFVMDAGKGQELKQLLKDLNSDRFELVTEFDDGFVVYFNGLEVAFLCPPNGEFVKEQAQPSGGSQPIEAESKNAQPTN